MCAGALQEVKRQWTERLEAQRKRAEGRLKKHMARLEDELARQTARYDRDHAVWQSRETELQKEYQVD